MSTSESIIRELVTEHGVNSIAVPCPVCRSGPLDSYVRSYCPFCHGDGKLQMDINKVEFCS